MNDISLLHGQQITPEQQFYFNEILLRYKFRPGVGDRNHLIVIFSGGFGTKNPYDFTGSVIHGLRASILWIKDDIDGIFSYYIQANGKKNVAHAVKALVDETREQLGLTRDQCTLAGFSKGGTASLFHGLSYGYRNILTTVPRINIGSGNARLRPEVLDGLTVGAKPEEIRELDSIIPDLIMRDPIVDRNVYLISSEADPQYKTEIQPIIPLLRKYNNFNFIKTSSKLVTRHNEVTKYNIPIILAILNSLTEGLVPRYGEVENGGNIQGSSTGAARIKKLRNSNTIEVGLSDVYFKRGNLYARGHAFVRGVNAANDSAIEAKLLLTSNASVVELPLGHTTDRSLSSVFYVAEYCNYSRAKFTSPMNLGWPIAQLPHGEYNLSIEFIHRGRQHSSITFNVEDSTFFYVHNNDIIMIFRKNNNVKINKIDPMDAFSKDSKGVNGQVAVIDDSSFDLTVNWPAPLLETVNSQPRIYVASLIDTHGTVAWTGRLEAKIIDSEAQRMTSETQLLSSARLPAGKLRIGDLADGRFDIYISEIGADYHVCRKLNGSLVTQKGAIR